MLSIDGDVMCHVSSPSPSLLEPFQVARVMRRLQQQGEGATYRACWDLPPATPKLQLYTSFHNLNKSEIRHTSGPSISD